MFANYFQYRVFFAALLAVWLSGCQTSIRNLTPSSVPENASREYTLRFAAALNSDEVVEDSVEAFVVVDGKKRRMEPIESAPYIFEYAYHLSAPRTTARYYFVLSYRERRQSGVRDVYRSSDLRTLRLVTRSPFSLGRGSAPVGSEVSLFGDNFGDRPTVEVGGKQAYVRKLSDEKIRFVVPEINTGKLHEVLVTTSQGRQSAGYMEVKKRVLDIEPDELNMRPGDEQVLLFKVSDATTESIRIELGSDLSSEQLELSSVRIPRGASTTNATIRALKPGQGFLRARIPNRGEVVIPVSVSAGEKDALEKEQDTTAPEKPGSGSPSSKTEKSDPEQSSTTDGWIPVKRDQGEGSVEKSSTDDPSEISGEGTFSPNSSSSKAKSNESGTGSREQVELPPNPESLIIEE